MVLVYIYVTFLYHAKPEPLFSESFRRRQKRFWMAPDATPIAVNARSARRRVLASSRDVDKAPLRTPQRLHGISSAANVEAVSRLGF